jgi:hypothetical protein
MAQFTGSFIKLYFILVNCTMDEIQSRLIYKNTYSIKNQTQSQKITINYHKVFNKSLRKLHLLLSLR